MIKKYIIAVVLGCLLGVFPLPQGFSDKAIDKEFEFAEGLIKLGFSDYAEKLINQLIKKKPSLKKRANSIKIKMKIANGKFAEAEVLIRAMPKGHPKTQESWLAIANAYYKSGKTEKATKIYSEFFSQFTNAIPMEAEAKDAFMKATYRVAQILERSRDFAGAIKAYNRLLSTKPTGGLLNKLESELAALYVKYAETLSGKKRQALLKKSKKLCNDILWRGIDPYFCQAVITLAQIELMQGNKKSAKKILLDNMRTFKQIEDFIKKAKHPLSMSPLAGANCLLGRIYQKEGEAILAEDEDKGIKLLGQALTHFYTVTAKYGESTWVIEASTRKTATENTLKALGKTIKVDLGPQTVVNKNILAQLRGADNLFYTQKKYPEARSEYLRIVNLYPDTTNSPRMLMNVARCSLHQQDNLMAKATAQYLGERFSGNQKAGTMLLVIGKEYSQQKDLKMLAYMYKIFLENFPNHDSVPAVLFSMAIIRKKAGDEAGAATYLQRIIKDHPTDPNYLKAFNQVAWSLYAAGKYEESAAGFKKFIEETRDEKLRPQARFGMADSYLRLNKFNQALPEFKTLKKSLERLLAKSGSSVSAKEKKQHKEMLERTCYLLAFCLTRADTPVKSVPRYRDEAIAVSSQFLKDYPKSKWAAKVLSLKGTVQIERGQIDEAVVTFNELADLYPDSKEGKNALVSMVQAAIDIKRYDVAQNAFKKMKKNKAFYLKQGKEEIFAYIGQVMFNAGQYPEAIDAYKILTSSSTTNKGLLENAFYFMGRTYCETTNYEESVSSLNTLLKRYPDSGYFYDAKFILGRSYRGLGQYNKVYEVLNDVATRTTNIVYINQASMELGKTQLKEKKKKQARASFMRVWLLADVRNPELRPMVEEALLECLKLNLEFNKLDDVINICNQYLEKFPNGDEVDKIKKIRRETGLKAVRPAPTTEP